MCMFKVRYPIEFSRLHNLHPWYWNSLLYNLMSYLWGEFSAFSAATAIHNSPIFVPPDTHRCWVDRGGMIWEAWPTPLHMVDSVTQAPVTHPSTNQAQRCLTSVIWRELITTRPCAIWKVPLSADFLWLDLTQVYEWKYTILESYTIHSKHMADS